MRYKVLHIVGTLDVGGIEKWISNMIKFEKTNLNEIDYHILSMHPTKKNIVPELVIEKEKIFYPDSLSVFNRLKTLYLVLKKINPDAVHIHPGYSSGIYSLICKFRKIKIVIVHSHSDRIAIDRQVGLLKKLYIITMKILINLCADHKISVSEKAAKTLFISEYKVHYCGVPDIDKEQIMGVNIEKLTLLRGENKNIIFHIGRDCEAKNYSFIIRLADAMKDYRDIVFVCIGSGLERYSAQCDKLQLRNIMFLGYCNEPSKIIAKYGSAFIMPSLWEGLPLSAVEAQKAKLFTILSDQITQECNLGAAVFLPLDVYCWRNEIVNHFANTFFNPDNKLLFTLNENSVYFKSLYENSFGDVS